MSAQTKARPALDLRFELTVNQDGGRIDALTPDGKSVGHLRWSFPRLSSWAGRAAIAHVEVVPEARRQGIATAMLDRARAAVDYSIEHSPSKTDDGEAWARAVG